MLSLKKKIKFLSILLVVAVGTSGCDLINSVKEYFQEPTEEESGQSSSLGSTGTGRIKEKAARKIIPGQASPMAANVLVRVGSWSITIDEFDERLQALKEVLPEFDINDPEAQKMVLDELINQQILVLGAEQTGLARGKDIQAAVEEFRRTLIVREVARQLTEDITVTEAEARTFYAENQEDLIGAEQWHVREIVLPTKERAIDILTDILGGADFENTARIYSVGVSAEKGGDLGFIVQEPFPQMGMALLSLEEGDVSGVFKGPEGYYIAKLEERKAGEQLSYEDIKEDIIQSQTLLKQQQVILDHLNRLKEDIKIEKNERLLQKH